MPHIEYAYVGGSAGRGDDDAWSDTDLTICTSNASYHCEKNIIFEGEIVQIFITDALDWDSIQRQPLDHRFLMESVPVYDPNSTFRSIKNDWSTFITSTKGKQKLRADWIALVQHRLKWAQASIQAVQLHTATAAVGAAWADAAFLLQYLERRSLSTGSLMVFMETSWPGFASYLACCEWLQNTNPSKGIRTVERFREYLRANHSGPDYDFSLSPIQDVIMGWKAKRFMQAEQYSSLNWQFAGEAFGLFLLTSKGQSLEAYLESLPERLRHALIELGFTALDINMLERVVQLVHDLVNAAYRYGE